MRKTLAWPDVNAIGRRSASTAQASEEEFDIAPAGGGYQGRHEMERLVRIDYVCNI